jgi:trk system potassium uptake protein TrkH
MRALLANLGFVMQMMGIFIIIPIVLSFAFNEPSATIGLFITALIFLAFGFSLNALCERKALSFKESSTLIVLVFILLSVIGAIPYIYINFSTLDPAENITNGIFEASSGFTTTGYSVIQNLSSIPQSIIFYRALTQFIGGMSIVLILVAFFYPEAKLSDFFKGMGFQGNQKIKKTFLLILLIYALICIIMISAGFILGYRDIVSLISFIFSALSTGGFHPFNDITSAATTFPLNIILIISMVLGASNFIVLAGLFKGKIKAFIKSEITYFIIIAIFSSVFISLIFKYNLFDSTFHVISAMSTTGFMYLDVHSFANSLKLFLIFLMFVGGASISTAGGIKIYRFLLLFKATKKAVVETITDKESPVKLLGKEYSNSEILQSLIVIFLFAAVIFFSTIIVSAYGYSTVDSLFDTTSAMATTGMSAGVISPSLQLELKWLFSALMLLGRFEVIAVLIIFSRRK